MIRLLMLVMGALAMALPVPDAAARCRSGELVRLHVVAHDDTPAMQQVKTAVRDAAVRCFADAAADKAFALPGAARQLVTRLAAAAQQSARDAGFTGEVRVRAGVFSFPKGRSGATVLPAGEYPAVLILLGDAQGGNWWGLIDPAGAMAAASPLGVSESAAAWDWSLGGFLKALLGRALALMKGA